MLPQTQQEEEESTSRDLNEKEVLQSIAALSDYLTDMRNRVSETKVKNCYLPLLEHGAPKVSF